MRNLLCLISIFMAANVLGQDSLKIMFHNILNFPSVNSNRYIQQRTILQYALPDVYVVNELESELGANLILDSALNVNGTTHYQKANFIDGYDTDNGLFYNSNKLGLLSQLQLGTVLRDISVYQLYYKAPNLSAQTDTIYFWFFSCHLKAGTADFEQRNIEAQQVKFYLNSIVGQAENVFVGGDFNFYSGYESGCQTLLNSGSIPLIDPVNAIGNWSNDWTYADWHTQSTRISSFGSGSGGGMDDRFDLIFVSEDVMNNENGVNYLNGTYQPLGQDGNHFNNDINAGSNAAVPDSIADALFNASDHLPIMMDVVLDETALVKENSLNFVQAYYDLLNHSLNFNSSYESFDLVLFDLMGRVVFQAQNVTNQVPLPEELKGVYIWSLNAKGNQISNKVVIQ